MVAVYRAVAARNGADAALSARPFARLSRGPASSLHLIGKMPTAGSVLRA